MRRRTFLKLGAAAVVGAPRVAHAQAAKGKVRFAYLQLGWAGPEIIHKEDLLGKHGWQAAPATGENQFEATKQEDGHAPTHFALQIASATGGSSGRFIVTGR